MTRVSYTVYSTGTCALLVKKIKINNNNLEFVCKNSSFKKLPDVIADLHGNAA